MGLGRVISLFNHRLKKHEFCNIGRSLFQYCLSMADVCLHRAVRSQLGALSVVYPCAGTLGRCDIAPDSRWDCASASHGSASSLAINTQGQYGNCLRAGNRAPRSLRACRAPQEASEEGEGCACGCTESSCWSAPPRASASGTSSV